MTLENKQKTNTDLSNQHMSPWINKSNEDTKKEDTVEKQNDKINADRLFSPKQDENNIYFIKESCDKSQNNQD